MIESYTKIFWFEELKERVIFLEGLYRKSDWSEELEFEFEKNIFIGFYSVRKLIESGLLADTLKGWNIKLEKYLPKDTVNNDYLAINDWHTAYNLLSGDEIQLTPEKICNQFIHSKIFSAFVPEGLGCVGVFVASDRDFKGGVFYIRLVEILEIFISIANNKITKLSVSIDKDNEISVNGI